MKEKIELHQASYDFLNLMITTHAPKSVNQYESCIRCFFKFLNQNNIKFENINREYIEKWLIWMVDAGHENTTRFRRLMCVRFFLRWCYEHGFLTQEQAELIKIKDFPKIPKRLPRPIPPYLDKIIIGRLKESESILHKGMLLARYTGIRIGELQKLPRECVYENIHGKKCLKVPLGKMNTERIVPLNNDAIDLIEEIKEFTLKNIADSRRKRYMCRECGTMADHYKRVQQENYVPERLIVLHNGRYPSYSGFRSCWNRLTKDLQDKDEKRLTIHRLRHTYATTMLTGGMSIVSLMKVLGHKDIRMTLIYGDVSQEKLHHEYQQALENLRSRYNMKSMDVPSETITIEPHVVLSDIVKWLDNYSYDIAKEQPKDFTSVLRRLKKLESDMKALGIKEKMPIVS